MGEYSFDLLPDGTPRYTQILRWEHVDDVLFYEVTVRDDAGKETSARVAESELRLSLAPGDYSYRIVLYNVFRKPEITLPWQELTVLKARIPRLASSAPRAWFLEDPKPPLLTLSVEDLVPGARFLLKAANGSMPAIEGAELERRGESTLRVSFPTQAIVEGTYSLEVSNPGGLSASIPGALFVRHMLPSPVVLEPAPGTALGPSELRNMKSLRFSWKPVPGANRYVFKLARVGAASALLYVQSLTDTTYLLDDLRVLDKGALSWTVESQGFDEQCGEIPSVPAQAGLTIDLPSISAPAIDEEEVFYGR